MEFLEAYGSGWFATVASFALLIYTMHIHRVLNRLKKGGVTVIADLTDKSSSPGIRTTVCKFHLSYVYEGIQYESKVSVTVEQYGNYLIGSQIPVTLLPDNPGKCYTEFNKNGKPPIFMYIFSAFIFLCGWLDIIITFVAR